MPRIPSSPASRGAARAAARLVVGGSTFGAPTAPSDRGVPGSIPVTSSSPHSPTCVVRQVLARWPRRSRYGGPLRTHLDSPSPVAGAGQQSGHDLDHVELDHGLVVVGTG